MDDLTQHLVAQLNVEEGIKLKPYLDTKGILTIGVGHNLQNGISKNVSDVILSEDIAGVRAFLGNYAWYTAQADVRKAALVSMAFMGPEKLLHFVSMIHYLTTGDFDKAGDEALNSEWAKEPPVGVGHVRANRIANMLRTATWPTDIPFPGAK